jgi:hypothetical protein
MRIRERQMAAIAEARALEQFEEGMTPRLRTFSPRHAKMIGESGGRAVVRLGIDRARPYALTNPGLLRLYVELMFMYGSFFDTDPLHPWAGEVLRDGAIADPAARATRLYEAMSSYYDSVSGEHLAHDRQALRGWEEARADEGSPEDPRFEHRLVGALSSAHPRRAAYLGDERLRAVARAASLRWATGEALGVTVTAFLMFTKGHGFADDPLLPGISAAVHEGMEEAPAARARRLEEAFLAYRAQILGAR